MKHYIKDGLSIAQAALPSHEKQIHETITTTDGPAFLLSRDEDSLTIGMKHDTEDGATNSRLKLQRYILHCAILSNWQTISVFESQVNIISSYLLDGNHICIPAVERFSNSFSVMINSLKLKITFNYRNENGEDTSKLFFTSTKLGIKIIINIAHIVSLLRATRHPVIFRFVPKPSDPNASQPVSTSFRLGNPGAIQQMFQFFGLCKSNEL